MKKFFEDKASIVITIVVSILVILAIIGIVLAAVNPAPVIPQ